MIHISLWKIKIVTRYNISEHLHVLSQEALDHADLPVLTATLGASALIKNSLHCYIQVSQHTGTGEHTNILQVTSSIEMEKYKQFYKLFHL